MSGIKNFNFVFKNFVAYFGKLNNWKRWFGLFGGGGREGLLPAHWKWHFICDVD